jgi:hypothetical protein
MHSHGRVDPALSGVAETLLIPLYNFEFAKSAEFLFISIFCVLCSKFLFFAVRTFVN